MNHGAAGRDGATGSLAESAVTAIERAEMIDSISGSLRSFVDRLVGDGVPRDLATGRWLGHPVHPAAVTVPLACWFGSTVLDLVGGRDARGAVSSPGRPRRRRGPSGRCHGRRRLARHRRCRATRRHRSCADDGRGSGHLRLVVVRAASGPARPRGGAGSRRRDGHRSGAFLGGHLAYRRGVGVDTTAFQAGPEDWTELHVTGAVTPFAPVAADVDGVAFAVVGRTGPAEPPHVLEARCTHRGGPLHEGTVADGCITCPWHDSRFDLETGAVRSGPASAPQPVYEVRAEDGGVSIRRAERGGLRRNPVNGPSH